MKDLLRLENLSKTYRIGELEVPALRGVDFSVKSGQYLAIMGHSGSGKSTMLNILGCLDRPTSGHYWLGDQDVAGLDDSALSEARNLKIGFVFQSFNLLSGDSVLKNIEVPMFYRGIPRPERHERSLQLAEMVGLADRVHHLPKELSGGQRQRVAIARALANEPLIILADEPTGNLDSSTSGEILDIFDELHQNGTTILMVTHEHDVASRAQRTICLSDGKILSDSHNGL